MSGGRLEQLLTEVESCNLEELRVAWRRHLGPPLPLRSKDLLRRMLAFELQAAAEGGLSAELKQRVRARSGIASKEPSLQPGTRLVREWRGERHLVEVNEQGFDHMGTRYSSLSEIARAITGARWSGPRFFGLTPTAGKKAA